MPNTIDQKDNVMLVKGKNNIGLIRHCLKTKAVTLISFQGNVMASDPLNHVLRSYPENEEGGQTWNKDKRGGNESALIRS